MTTPARMRAGDQDREEVADRLREAHIEGRLSLAELGERLDTGYRATYVDELPALVADLPPVRTAPREPASAPRWSPRWSFPPFVLLVVVASLLLVAAGVFPFPLIWLALGWLLWRHRRWGSRHARFTGYPVSGARTQSHVPVEANVSLGTQ